MVRKSKKIVGIAYHSPLDVITLVPHKTRVTLQPGDEADVFFSQDDVNENCLAPVQIVFASPRLLLSKEIKILDQGVRGQILNLNNLDWKKVLA